MKLDRNFLNNTFARHILKGSNYVGSANYLQRTGFMRPLVPLNALTIQDTSPVKCCRVCRGQRIVGNHHANHLVDYERCPNCGGLGTMDVRKLEVRR